MANTSIEVMSPSLPDLSGLLYDYQKADIASEARYRWSCWSRQVGKSYCKSLRRILRGIKRRRDQIFLSASAQQSRELMTKARDWVKVLNLAFAYNDQSYFADADIRQLEITLPQFGIRIIGLPANPRTVRGFTGDVLLDEFAMHRDDTEIWKAMFPILARDGGELDVASTPNGRSNMFYRMGQESIFERTTLNIYQAVAQGCPHDIESLRAGIMDDQAWRQEFLCEFVDEATAFLTYEMIGKCEDEKLERALDVEALADCSGDIYVGIDVGRKHDLTVLWAFEQAGSSLIHRGLIELASMTFRKQLEILSSVIQNRCVKRCCIDATGLGMQLAEELGERFGTYRVEPCTFTPGFKEQAAGALRIKIEDGLMRLPVDVKIRHDLHSIQRTVTAAGNVRLFAPREDGSHADRFWAAALAVEAAGNDAGPVECLMGDTYEERASW